MNVIAHSLVICIVQLLETSKKYYLFGFTGTPIFNINQNPNDCKTTKQIFGEQLHSYTIGDAIKDKNVLKFNIQYHSTTKLRENVKDELVKDINREEVFLDSRRIKEVVKYIIENFSRMTCQNKYLYAYDGRIRKGFNSILCVDSIEMSKLYYNEFKFQQANLEQNKKLRIATIFSSAPNEDISDEFLSEENSESTDNLNEPSRDFLEKAIGDYNKMFYTNFDTSSEKFQNYYKDVSHKMKYKEIDILIVVNMFFTGFDAPTLNTLWVDKNLRMHGLLQAFSRTNRIFNSLKQIGNIICFRPNLRKNVDEAFETFGSKDTIDVCQIWGFKEQFYGYDERGIHYMGYLELVEELKKYPWNQEIIGEENQRKFIKLFGLFLRKNNILSSFDKFYDKENEAKRWLNMIFKIIKVYILIYVLNIDNNKSMKKTYINDDLVFEVDYIDHCETTVDYILNQSKKKIENHQRTNDILNWIIRNTGLNLHSKLDLIKKFISQINLCDLRTSSIDNFYCEFNNFSKKEQNKELNKIINEDNLNYDMTVKLVREYLNNNIQEIKPSEIVRLLPQMSRFGGQGQEREIKKNRVIDRLQAHLKNLVIWESFIKLKTLN